MSATELKRLAAARAFKPMEAFDEMADNHVDFDDLVGGRRRSPTDRPLPPGMAPSFVGWVWVAVDQAGRASRAWKGRRYRSQRSSSATDHFVRGLRPSGLTSALDQKIDAGQFTIRRHDCQRPEAKDIYLGRQRAAAGNANYIACCLNGERKSDLLATGAIRSADLDTDGVLADINTRSLEEDIDGERDSSRKVENGIVLPTTSYDRGQPIANLGVVDEHQGGHGKTTVCTPHARSGEPTLPACRSHLGVADAHDRISAILSVGS